MLKVLKNRILNRLMHALDVHYVRIDSPSTFHAVDFVECASDDALLRCTVNGVSLLMPAGYLRMFRHCHVVTRGQPLAYLIETGHCNWMTGKLSPGDVAVDIGASAGSVTASLAKKVGPTGHVFAFEPARRAYSMLTQVVSANHLSHVTTEQIAVSDNQGIARFAEYGIDPTGQNLWLPEASTLMTNVAQSSPLTTEYEVKTTTLDAYFAEFSKSIRLVKIDVEGFEVDVLNGAQSLIKRNRPYFSIDIHKHPRSEGDTENEVKSLLGKLDYRFERLGHVLLATPG